jgi:hypothetical protein
MSETDMNLQEEVAKAMALAEYTSLVGRMEFSWDEDLTRYQKERYRSLARIAVDMIKRDGVPVTSEDARS